MREEHRRSEKGPRFERSLQRLSDDAAEPSSYSDVEDDVLCRRVQHPLLVFSVEGRGTRLLPLWKSEGQLTSSAAFLNEEGEHAVGPLLVAATIEELVQVAFAHYQLAVQQARVPFDQHMGAYRGVRFFRLATWPEPLYLCGPSGRARNLIAMMVRDGDTGTGQRVACVVRWNLDGEEAPREEEIRGKSSDQVFRRLLLRYRCGRLALFWMARTAMWTVRALTSLLIIGIQAGFSALVWFLRPGAEPPSASISLACAAALIGLGGTPLVLQPVLLPQLPAAQTRRGRWLRTLLMGLLFLLEWAALANVTGAEKPPLIAGLTFFSALSAWFPTVFAVSVIEWAIGIIFRDDVQAERRAGPAPAP